MNWQTVLDRIRIKTQAVAARNAHKIPYTAHDGVFDDCSRDICWWTNGFWAGLLWQLYAVYGDGTFRTVAEEIEGKLDQNFLNAHGMDHDSGFKWLPTAGADYTVTGSAASKNRLLLAAGDLAGRFNAAGNFIRAWNDEGDGNRAGIAIIDCMMNLPLLYRASELTNDPRFLQIAMRHADTAAHAFVRADGSVCHVVKFDPVTGKRLQSLGGQGYGHGSAWTRGQAWALYGFTLSYLHTKKALYLDTAKKVAEYFLANIPADGLIPVDFRQPPRPAYTDDSAAAIAACGFLTLGSVTGDVRYGAAAEKMLEALVGVRCDLGTAGDPMLLNCSAAYGDDRHGFPLIYGDYFFTEAVLKLTGKETFLW